MSTCRVVEPLLDELADGSLDAARARAARAHLRTCASCAALLEATEVIRSAAGNLGSVEPPADLWRNLTDRLDVAEAEVERRPRIWWLWHAWQRTLYATCGGLAAAAVVLAVWTTGARQSLGPAFAALPRPPVSAVELYDEALADVARAEKDYTAAIDELSQVAAAERQRWTPEAARAFDENLAAIDAAIARQAEAGSRAPSDPLAADALHATYKKKIDFIQEAIVRGSL